MHVPDWRRIMYISVCTFWHAWNDETVTWCMANRHCVCNPNPSNGQSCQFIEMQASPLQIILERSIKITYPFQFEATSQSLQLTKLWERRTREKRRASSLQITSLWDCTTFSGLKWLSNFIFIVSWRLDTMANSRQTSTSVGDLNLPPKELNLLVGVVYSITHARACTLSLS